MTTCQTPPRDLDFIWNLKKFTCSISLKCIAIYKLETVCIKTGVHFENQRIQFAMWKYWQLELFVWYWFAVYPLPQTFVMSKTKKKMLGLFIFNILSKHYGTLWSPWKNAFCPPLQIVQSGRGMVSTLCGHMFCKDCLHEALDRTHACPKCRTKLTRKQYHPIYFWLVQEDDWCASTCKYVLSHTCRHHSTRTHSHTCTKPASNILPRGKNITLIDHLVFSFSGQVWNPSQCVWLVHLFFRTHHVLFCVLVIVLHLWLFFCLFIFDDFY